MANEYQRQIAQLRNEIEEKQSGIADLKDENQKLSLAFEQLQRDHDRLKDEESKKSKQLNVRKRSVKSCKCISMVLLLLGNDRAKR